MSISLSSFSRSISGKLIPKFNWSISLKKIPLLAFVFIGLIGCGEFKSSHSSDPSSSVDPNGPLPPIRENFEFSLTTYLDVSNAYTCDAAAIGLAENQMRRLTKQEIQKSLALLFGESLLSVATVREALSVVPVESSGVYRIEQFDNRILNLDSILDLSLAVGKAVTSDVAILNRVLPGCNGGLAIATCVDQLVQGLGKRIYRRPLTSTEASEIRTAVTDLGNDKDALGAAISRLIASPFFHQLYLGESSTEIMGRVRLTPYEVASRLSFTLTGAMPDDALLAAADRDELQTISQIRTQAARLIETPQAKDHFIFFLRNWLDIGISDPDPVTSSYRGIDPRGLGTEIDNEFKDFINYIVFQKNGTLKDLYTDKSIFPRTQRLAQLYGVAQASTQMVSFTDGRSGLLMRPSLHKQLTPITSPISRGVRFRKKVLCSNLPSPDATVVAERANAIEQLSHVDFSNRSIVTNVTNDRRCQSCHMQINPLGFVFESFGALGELRSSEPIFDQNGAFVKAHPIDSQISDAVIPGRSPAAISSPSDLVQEIAASEASHRCFAQQFFREARIRNAQSSDGCLLNSMSEVLTKGGSIKEALITGIANEDIFWRVAK